MKGIILLFMSVLCQLFVCRTIEFSGLIKCPKPRWCFHIAYWEEDNYWDDYVIETNWKCSNRPDMKSSIVAEFGSDFSLHYEFYMFVNHNCTEFGNYTTFRHNFTDTPALQTVKVLYELNITNMSAD